MSETGDWDCDAYGPDGREFGALCFIADLGERLCLFPAVCHMVMAAERQRVYRRISELAAQGHPEFAELEAAFPDPGKLLSGES